MKNFNKHYIIDEGMVYLIGDILDDTKNVISKLNEIELEGSTLIFLGNSNPSTVIYVYLRCNISGGVPSYSLLILIKLL